MENLSWDCFLPVQHTHLPHTHTHTHSVGLIKYMRSSALPGVRQQTVIFDAQSFTHSALGGRFRSRLSSETWSRVADESNMKCSRPRTFSRGKLTGGCDHTLLLTVCRTSFESSATSCNRERTVLPLKVKRGWQTWGLQEEEGATAGKLAVFKSLLLTWGTLASDVSLASVFVLVCASCFPSSSSSHVPPLTSHCFKGTVQPKTKTHCGVLVIHLDCFSASFQPQIQWNQTALLKMSNNTFERFNSSVSFQKSWPGCTN